MASASPEPIVYIKAYKVGAAAEQWKDLCYKSVTEKKKEKISPSILVQELEDYMLRSMQDTTSALYEKFQANMKRVAVESRVNLFVLIGHSNFCQNYITKFIVDIRDGKIPQNTNYPNVLLMIACYSYEQIDAIYDAFEDSNLEFNVFTFDGLIHIVEGEIYSCKDLHEKLPRMRCNFKGAKTNLNSITPENSLFVNEANLERHPVKQCCLAKFKAFEKNFQEELQTRNCTKITVESMIQKIQNLLQSNKEPNNKKNTVNNISNLIFNESDGVKCTPESPCIVPSEELLKAKKTSNEFNTKLDDASLFEDKWRDLQEVIREEPDQAIEVIKKLKKEELVLLDWKPEQNESVWDQPYLYLAIYQGSYNLVMYLLTQKLAPINLRREFVSKPFYLSMVQFQHYTTYLRLLLTSKDNFQDWQVFNILYILYQKDPTLFFQKPSEEYMALYKAQMYDTFYIPKSIFLHAFKLNVDIFLLFYFFFFKSKIVWEEEGIGDLLDHKHTFEDYKPNQLKLLLSFGVNPNLFNDDVHKYINRTFITSLWNHNSVLSDAYYSVLQYFIAYGYEIQTKTQINETLTEINELLTLNPQQLQQTKRYKNIKELKRHIYFYRVDEQQKMDRFLRYPMEYLRDKKQYLERLLAFDGNVRNSNDEIKAQFRQQNTDYTQSLYEEKAMEDHLFRNLPARAEMLKRLDETQRFLKSKLAARIPSEKKQQFLEVLKSYTFPTGFSDKINDPDYTRLEKMIEMIGKFLEKNKSLYNNPSNLNTNTTRKLKTVPNVPSLQNTMEGGKRKQTRRRR